MKFIILVRSGTDDGSLQKAVTEGHKWYILGEGIPEEEAIMVSEYRNADQHTDQACWNVVRSHD